MASYNTAIDVLLTGYDPILLERVKALLDAIREVTARVVPLGERSELADIPVTASDVIIHLLPSRFGEELLAEGTATDELALLHALLQKEQHSPPALILVSTGSDPLTEQQVSKIRARIQCALVQPPFDERNLLPVLDRIHDDILGKRKQGESATESAGGKLVVATGAGGGCGVSLLSACLARQLADTRTSETERAVLLMDGDWRYGSQSTLNDCHPLHDFRDLLNRTDSDQTTLNSYLAPINNRLNLLGPLPEQLATVGPVGKTASLLSLMRREAGIIVADIPSWNHEFLRDLTSVADHLVLVLRPEIDGLRRARLLLQEVQNRMDQKQITVVVNGISRFTSIDEQAVRKALKRVPVMVPEDKRSVIRSLESGRLPVETATRSPYCKALSQLQKQLFPVRPIGQRSPLHGWRYYFGSAH